MFKLTHDYIIVIFGFRAVFQLNGRLPRLYLEVVHIRHGVTCEFVLYINIRPNITRTYCEIPRNNQNHSSVRASPIKLLMSHHGKKFLISQWPCIHKMTCSVLLRLKLPIQFSIEVPNFQDFWLNFRIPRN